MRSESAPHSTSGNSPSKKPFDVVGNIMAFENGDLDETETIALFQHLVDTRLAWSLQGSYGRMARTYIDAGLVFTADEMGRPK